MTVQNSGIDIWALSSISSSLQKLADGGSPKDVWFKLFEEDLQILSTHGATADRKAIVRTVETVQKIKRTLSLLSDLSTCLEDVLEELKERAMPAIMHHGINIIPDEILAIILDMASQGTIPSRSFVTYSSVCRRFRNCLVNNRSSSLWTWIETFRRRDWIGLQLKRSDTCPLSVTTHVFRTKKAVQWFWDILSPHFVRLRELRISSCREYLRDDPDSRHASLKHITPSALDLPKLETLHIFDLNNGLEVSGRSSNRTPPFTSWNIPKLKRLTTDETLFALAPQVPDTLISLAFVMKQHAAVRTGDLVGIVRRFSGLESLSLDLGAGFLPNTQNSSSPPTAHLDCLRRLDLRFEDPEQSNETVVQDIMRKLLIPNVQMVSIRFSVQRDAKFHIHVEKWLRQQNMDHLRKLEIYVSGFAPGAAIETEFEQSLREWIRGKWGASGFRPALDVNLNPNQHAHPDQDAVLEEGFNWWE